jgi:hypothetical protein
MSFSSALRADSFSMTTPVYSSSTSMTTSSIGSRRSPFSAGLIDHARTRDGDFEAFAAHVLDQHAQLQFAAAGDFDRRPFLRSR